MCFSDGFWNMEVTKGKPPRQEAVMPAYKRVQSSQTPGPLTCQKCSYLAWINESTSYLK